ncbi:extracellular solute-binding protein [Nonomuraea sp. NPDC059194]|uniref:extracellular solute-binding protein n=1 Tax=Nonomuraea sp. NPDC059194 TaxID=3346764 RepID=UPI0036AD218E
MPEAEYTKTIEAASAAELPDVLEFDGSNLARLVYDRKLGPIDAFVSPSTQSNATAAMLAQGTIDGRLYGLGLFDAGLGVWGNKKLLDAAGVRYPSGLGDAWTAEEFTGALAKLAAKDPDGKVLDLKENYGFGVGSEWATYAFGPVVWSSGGNLIEDGKAEGVLDTPSVARGLTTVQGWKKYVDPDPKGQAFVNGDVALSWVGHWMYPAYVRVFWEDLVLLPLPDFGNGVKTSQGSWAWGVSAGSANGKAAGAFLDYLLTDNVVVSVTAANGAPPGTRSALAKSNLYQPGGRLSLYAEQLRRTCGSGPVTATCVAVPRPVTAGYPVVTREFAQAFKSIYGGADVRASLDRAAEAIDIDYAGNDGYRIS